MMDAVISALYGGDEVAWFPVWAADLWRVIFWSACVVWVAKVGIRYFQRGLESGTVYWARFALLILFARIAWVQVHNWGEPIAWDGLPVTTLALACAWMAAYRYENPKQGDPVLSHGGKRPPLPPRPVHHTPLHHPRRRATDQ